MARTKRVHLYSATLDALDDAEVRPRCDALLSADERARRDRFVFDRHRREYVYAHALVRRALSRHAPEVAPEAWRFVAGSHGRPAVSGPAPVPPLHFNLSHTSGVVACVVAAEPLVGVDVEAMDRGEATALAERYFAPPEVEALRRLPLEAQRERFFRYWTLKESYIKARGLGLALPLDQFWFDLAPSGAVTIAFGPGIADTPSAWRFLERPPTPEHRLAVALATPDEADWEIDLVEGDGRALLQATPA